MSKDTVSDWSTTPASNTDVGGVDLAENSMRPRDVNNAIRTMMAQLKTFLGGTVPGFLDGILTTRGDILRRGATTSERVPLGAVGYALKSDGTDAAWAPDRAVLSASRTYYVRTDGSDSNTGLANTAGGAFLTLQKAWDTVAALDMVTFTVTVQVADGTYAAGVLAAASPVGTASVIFQGNSGTPANVHLSITGNGFNLTGPAQITVKDMKLSCTGTCLYTQHTGAKLQFGNINFGASGDHLRNDVGSLETLSSTSGNYTISGGAARHILGAGPGFTRQSGNTVTLTGTPAWSGEFCNFGSGAQIVLFSTTYSGSATGKRYTGTLNAVLNSFGAGTLSTYFPGNSNGSTATGAQQG